MATFPSWLRLGAAVIALIAPGGGPGAAQQPARTYTVEMDAEKDYFAPDTVRVAALSGAAGEVALGELDVTIRRRIEIAVPTDARELIFRTTKNITAKLRLSSGNGKILVRPLSSAGSASGIAWMLGRRGGITLERLVVEFEGR